MFYVIIYIYYIYIFIIISHCEFVFSGVFAGFGLSGVIPAIHYAIAEGWFNPIMQSSLGWLSLMGCLYILGAIFYALRVPERFFPGKCDIWVRFLFPVETLHSVEKKKLLTFMS